MQRHDHVVSTGHLSKSMCDKVAGSGLTLNPLRVAYRRGGRKGLETLFGEKVRGKVRVTKNERVIDNVCNYLDLQLNNLVDV